LIPLVEVKAGKKVKLNLRQNSRMTGMKHLIKAPDWISTKPEDVLDLKKETMEKGWKKSTTKSQRRKAGL